MWNLSRLREVGCPLWHYGLSHVISLLPRPGRFTHGRRYGSGADWDVKAQRGVGAARRRREEWPISPWQFEGSCRNLFFSIHLSSCRVVGCARVRARLRACLQGSEVCEELMTDGHHHCQRHICQRVLISTSVIFWWRPVFPSVIFFYDKEMGSRSQKIRDDRGYLSIVSVLHQSISQSVSFSRPLLFDILSQSSTGSAFSQYLCQINHLCLPSVAVWSAVFVCTSRSNCKLSVFQWKQFPRNPVKTGLFAGWPWFSGSYLSSSIS